MVTSIPNACNCRAAVRPEIPEPTTITLGAFLAEMHIKQHTHIKQPKLNNTGTEYNRPSDLITLRLHYIL